MIGLGDPRLPARFWAKVRVDEMSGCWLWTGATRSGGYGVFGVGSLVDGSRGTVFADRHAYEHLVGPIPEGAHLDHVAARGCWAWHCVNPAHLEPVTPGVNFLRSGHPNVVTHRERRCQRGHDLSEPASRRGTRCRICQNDSQRRRRASRG